MTTDASDTTGPRILIVEDNVLIARHIRMVLERGGYGQTSMVNTVSDALDALRRDAPDVMLLDLDLNGESTEPVYEAARGLETKVICVTGYSSGGIIPDEAPRVLKPFDPKDLLQAVVDVL